MTLSNAQAAWKLAVCCSLAAYPQSLVPALVSPGQHSLWIVADFLVVSSLVPQSQGTVSARIIFWDISLPTVSVTQTEYGSLGLPVMGINLVFL